MTLPACTELKKLGTKKRAKINSYFFKTGKGEYGEGDFFLGVRMPQIRILAKKYIDLSFKDIKTHLKSKYHEERLFAVIVLVNKYKKSKDNSEKNKIFNFYIKNFKSVNNWDLVDVSCPHIIGPHLINNDRSILYTWAKSKHLWTRRIAIVSNWWFIRNNDLKDVFKISKILLHDEHDLIHKAVGWMLREAGKKDTAKLESFLKQNYKKMPRTMLRYSIEKFPQIQRKKYLAGEV